MFHPITVHFFVVIGILVLCCGVSPISDWPTPKAITESFSKDVEKCGVKFTVPGIVTEKVSWRVFYMTKENNIHIGDWNSFDDAEKRRWSIRGRLSQQVFPVPENEYRYIRRLMMLHELGHAVATQTGVIDYMDGFAIEIEANRVMIAYLRLLDPDGYEDEVHGLLGFFDMPASEAPKFGNKDPRDWFNERNSTKMTGAHYAWFQQEFLKLAYDSQAEMGFCWLVRDYADAAAKRKQGISGSRGGPPRQ